MLTPEQTEPQKGSAYDGSEVVGPSLKVRSLRRLVPFVVFVFAVWSLLFGFQRGSGPEVGAQPLSFEVQTSPSGSFDTRSQNEPYLLSFWAEWCATCKHGLPELNAAFSEHHIPGSRIVDR